MFWASFSLQSEQSWLKNCGFTLKSCKNLAKFLSFNQNTPLSSILSRHFYFHLMKSNKILPHTFSIESQNYFPICVHRSQFCPVRPEKWQFRLGQFFLKFRICPGQNLSCLWFYSNKGQGSKGIRQWLINWCTSSMMILKITP